MKYLLDTHAFLWFVLNDSHLSDKAKETITEPANGILVSPVTFWEIAIKVSLGKYQLAEPYVEFFEQQLSDNRFQQLPIELKHTALVAGMPFHHRDPFDRLLVAQALTEKATLISADDILDAYGVKRLW